MGTIIFSIIIMNIIRRRCLILSIGLHAGMLSGVWSSSNDQPAVTCGQHTYPNPIECGLNFLFGDTHGNGGYVLKAMAYMFSSGHCGRYEYLGHPTKSNVSTIQSHKKNEASSPTISSKLLKRQSQDGSHSSEKVGLLRRKSSLVSPRRGSDMPYGYV